jgi:hypothetical protein
MNEPVGADRAFEWRRLKSLVLAQRLLTDHAPRVQPRAGRIHGLSGPKSRHRAAYRRQFARIPPNSRPTRIDRRPTGREACPTRCLVGHVRARGRTANQHRGAGSELVIYGAVLRLVGNFRKRGVEEESSVAALPLPRGG